MMLLELTYNNKVHKEQKDILDILQKEELYWLIDSECLNAIIEIKKNTVIWKDGVYLSGDWHYGIFQNGKFYGVWQNGIFENGSFQGTWISGIDLTKNNPINYEKKEESNSGKIFSSRSVIRPRPNNNKSG